VYSKQYAAPGMSSETERASAPQRRISIRWRLAGTSSLLTCLVLVIFGAGVGSVLAETARSNFKDATADAAKTLTDSLSVTLTPEGFAVRGVDVNDYAGSLHARIRVLDLSGRPIVTSLSAPDFGILAPGEAERSGYLVVTRPVVAGLIGRVMVQYGRPAEDLERSIRGIWLALGIGVVGGSLLALIAGLFVTRRMLRPLAALTDAASEVGRTGDATVSIPVPTRNDEVRDLAETLREALHELDTARAEAEVLLARQRDFVADASHELRTPLTSLIANLEMLVSSTAGESRIDADAALRSSRRMSQLVSDLLLLARADGKRTRFEPIDVDRIAREAVAEISPLLEARTLNTRLEDTSIDGEEVALFRAIRNLLDNAVAHTPDGTTIELTVTPQGDCVLIGVEDSGPGIPEVELDKIFDRFVRGGSLSNRGTGLGLSIVSAVAAAHSGSVRAFRSKLGGAGFEILLPLNQVSTTTGTTIGRRRN